jgi:mevalonate kinase
MIPRVISCHLQKRELHTNDYLKLCGSGGGGYILGFTEDLERAKLLLKDYKLEYLSILIEHVLN